MKNKRIMALASGIVALSVVLLVVGMILVPKLTEGDFTYDPGNMNDGITSEESITTLGGGTPTVEETTVTEVPTTIDTEVIKTLEDENKIDVQYNKVDLVYRQEYITTVGDVLHLEYDNIYSGSLLIVEDSTATKIKEPLYLPEGYSYKQNDYENNRRRTTFTSENDSEFPLYIVQGKSYTNNITKYFTDNENIYTVSFDGFFGILSEYEDTLHFSNINKGTRRYLLFCDYEHYYCIGGIEFEREELIKIALGLQPSKMEKPSVKVVKDGGFSAEYVNYPVGYTYGYVDTNDRFIFRFESNNKNVCPYSLSYHGEVEDIIGHSMPKLEGYEILKYSEGNYIYTKDGEEMFLFSVQGHTDTVTIRYNNTSTGFYNVYIGKNKGILIAEKTSPRCLSWSDGKYDYSLEPISGKTDAQKLLEVSRSLSKETPSYTDYTEPADFKWVYAKDNDINFQTVFVDKGDYFTVWIKNYTNGHSSGILSSLYVAKDQMPGNAPPVMFFDVMGVDGSGGIVLRFSLSKSVFENADKLTVNYYSMSDLGIYWTASYSLESGKVICKVPQLP